MASKHYQIQYHECVIAQRNKTDKPQCSANTQMESDHMQTSWMSQWQYFITVALIKSD